MCPPSWGRVRFPESPYLPMHPTCCHLHPTDTPRTWQPNEQNKEPVTGCHLQEQQAKKLLSIRGAPAHPFLCWGCSVGRFNSCKETDELIQTSWESSHIQALEGRHPTITLRSKAPEPSAAPALTWMAT